MTLLVLSPTPDRSRVAGADDVNEARSQRRPGGGVRGPSAPCPLHPMLDPAACLTIYIGVCAQAVEAAMENVQGGVDLAASLTTASIML